MNELVFVWDGGFLGDKMDGGNIIRKYKGVIDYNTPLVEMRDGQIWDYHNAIPVTAFKCPKCGNAYTDNTSKLVLGKEAIGSDGEQLVCTDYIGACLDCDEDFYLFELVHNLSTYLQEEKEN